MPRDASGLYSTPVGTDAIADHTIESTRYNSNVHDVETDLNAPRPIVAGGTGAVTGRQALINLGGEAALQQVISYDTAPFISGSFFSDQATGRSAPVDGHAFVGTAIVYGP